MLICMFTIKLVLLLLKNIRVKFLKIYFSLHLTITRVIRHSLCHPTSNLTRIILRIKYFLHDFYHINIRKTVYFKINTLL